MMINLLPEDKKRAFKRTYFVRLLIVFLATLTVLMVIHSVLLVPTYAFLQARIQSQVAEKDFLTRSLEATGGGEVEERLNLLTQQIETLEGIEETVSFVAIVEDILEVSRNGVVLTQVLYDPENQNVDVELRGTAQNRDALRSFAARLEAREGIESVDFPIGNLSREEDLPFTISIVFAS